MPSVVERLAAAAESMRAGDSAAALATTRAILEIPGLTNDERVAALRLHARAAEAQKDFAAAFADLDRVSTLAPAEARSWSELGLLHAVTEDLPRAIEALRRALALDDTSARTWNNLGSALWKSRALAEARAAFERAVALDAGYAHAYANLGMTLRDLGRTAEAETALERAIALNPRHVGALTNLAGIRQRDQRLPEAVKLFIEAVRLAPEDAEVCAQLGRAMADADDLQGARRVFAEAVRRDPTLLRAHIGRHLLLPNIYADEADITAARAAYADGMTVLESELPRAAAPLDAAARLDGLRWSNFLLAYQGRDDRALQARYGALATHLVASADESWAEAAGRRVAGGRKVRIAFASSFLHDGTVGRYFASWITDIDRSRYEVVVYHLHAADDSLVASLRASADRFRVMPRRSPSAIARAIREDAPDVLVYPELGMDATTFALATLRLAPLQCAAWGHPVTTGHPAIDVFFSSEAMEPADSASHYTERLECLPGIGTRYRMPESPPGADRAALGLPEGRTLFLCPQSHFKILPDDDALFARVLARSPRATLVLFDGRNPILATRFRTRLERTLTAAGVDPATRVLWLPGMRHDRYLQVNAACDAMLDTGRWSGGNTSLDAIASALPIVTHPGRFMRARQSAGMLSLMGITQTVAASDDAYVDIAARIADDPAWRERQSAHIRAHRARIFDDAAPVAALYAAIERHLRALS